VILKATSLSEPPAPDATPKAYQSPTAQRRQSARHAKNDSCSNFPLQCEVAVAYADVNAATPLCRLRAPAPTFQDFDDLTTSAVVSRNMRDVIALGGATWEEVLVATIGRPESRED